MGKYIIIFILWAIVTGVIVVATGAVSTDNVTDDFSCNQPDEAHQLTLIGEGAITGLSYVNNSGYIIKSPQINPDMEVYIDTFVFLLNGAETKVKNPNLFSGKFCTVYDVNGNVATLIENGKHYYIYNLDKKGLLFSEVPKRLDSEGNIINME
jgi:hypothetical protein